MEPDLPPPPGATARSRVRWGIPDSALAWLVGVVVSVVAGLVTLLVALPFVEMHGNGIPDRLEVPLALASLFAQGAAIVAYAAWVARRKGLGSLRADFGLDVRLRDAPWALAGIGLAIVGNVVAYPIVRLAGIDETTQAVAQIFERATGVELALFVVGVLVVAPLSEELLFRGMLLRGLERRTTIAWSAFASALAFALVHFLLDPGTGYYVPVFLLLGLVSGYQAARTGSLSRSVFLHAGFNLLAAVAIVAS